MHFEYKDKSSKDFGIKIINSNHLGSPARRVDKETIPGRKEGDLLIDYGNYENFVLNLECDIDAQSTSLEVVAQKLRIWLQGPVSYAPFKLYRRGVLVKTYEAAFISKLDISETFINFGACMLSFECKPPVDSEV